MCTLSGGGGGVEVQDDGRTAKRLHLGKFVQQKNERPEERGTIQSPALENSDFERAGYLRLKTSEKGLATRDLGEDKAPRSYRALTGESVETRRRLRSLRSPHDVKEGESNAGST